MPDAQIFHLFWKDIKHCTQSEQLHDKTNERICTSIEHSDAPSLIKVFAVRMKKAWVLRSPVNAQLGLWSDCADAQADLSRLAHMSFLWFIFINYSKAFPAQLKDVIS